MEGFDLILEQGFLYGISVNHAGLKSQFVGILLSVVFEAFLCGRRTVQSKFRA